MDRWIISYTQSLLVFVHQEMAAYRLYTVVPRLVRFVDYLTNWYVRMNRKRLKVHVNFIVFISYSIHSAIHFMVVFLNREMVVKMIAIMLCKHFLVFCFL